MITLSANDKELQNFLHRLGDAVLDYQRLQGFLFAIACSPEPVKPSEWFELIWLDDEPQFDTEAEAKRFFEDELAAARRERPTEVRERPSEADDFAPVFAARFRAVSLGARRGGDFKSTTASHLARRPSRSSRPRWSACARRSRASRPAGPRASPIS